MNWDPTQFFREDTNNPPPPFALVILNQPINGTALSVLRKHALMTVCADGGANRFFEWAASRKQEGSDLPSTIIGDLDSIRPEIRTHYASRGVNIIEDNDQYSTDFTKSLRYLREHESDILSSYSIKEDEDGDSRRLEILILGGLGGRVDQAFSQIHHLYMMNQNQKQKQKTDSSDTDSGSTSRSGNLYLISEESITFILQPGQNTIHVPRTNRARSNSNQDLNETHPNLPIEKEVSSYLLEENVGIIPLSGPARISTRGLQWDVKDWATEIGGQISTSNHIRAEVVEVETGVPVLFTLELARRLKRVSRQASQLIA
ncbi:thiamine pyrophosphokinase [Aspergillus cavernicola]|uniref:Thiamine pyrophosphokinase n=1 Tax=Aspergillus cavernicola TaxID=176166 RepID=A0ABR4IC58_9EURO